MFSPTNGTRIQTRVYCVGWKSSGFSAWVKRKREQANTRRLSRVSNVTRVSSDTMVELLGKIAAINTQATTLVPDNARYQHCVKVEAATRRVGIDLLFLTSYSPNLIERLWKFTKKQALRGKPYTDFTAFQAAIDDCLDQTATEFQKPI